jgi:hypothetical protein
MIAPLAFLNYVFATIALSILKSVFEESYLIGIALSLMFFEIAHFAKSLLTLLAKWV